MKRMIAVLTALAVSSSAAAAGEGFDAGAAAYETGDHGAALAQWVALAQGGDADAQFNLGIMYDQGIGVGPQPGEAVYWFAEAARQGDPIAAFNLGLIYADGRGVLQDFAQAAHWLELAVESHHPGAMEKLSVLYANGRGVERDLGRAVRLTELAQEAACLLDAPELNHVVRLTATGATLGG